MPVATRVGAGDQRKSAEAPGLTATPALAARADRVIE
jgi:hypothetical protein